jgi:hypothetical protein
MKTVDRALALLAHYGNMTAGELGARLWPGRRSRGVSSNGGGDYAAQMLLGRLRKRNFVGTIYGSGASVWAVTRDGRSYLRKLEAH